MIVIGASLGGMRALRRLLTSLPPSFPMPIGVVLHRYKESNGELVEILEQNLPLPLHEVLDKEPIRPGHVYVAPADYHLLVEPAHFCLSVDEPVQYARPSIDVLFESAADAFGPMVIGVILTGANQDGSRGAVSIQKRGGLVIVQDPATAESPFMPQAAMEATGTRYVFPIQEIGSFLVKLASQKQSP